MQYMLLIYVDPAESRPPDSPEAQAEMDAWMKISQEMAAVTVSSAALQPTATATTVRTNGSGDAVLTDGPFAETKEFLAGYYVIDVPDLDTATSWAARLPNQGRGSVEVRPVMELPTA